MQRRFDVLIGAGIVFILATGIIHYIDAHDSFEDAVYKGLLFYANGAGSLLSAAGIYRARGEWGWNLGCCISVVSLILYLFSRTVGLPAIPAEPDAWFEPLGVASLLMESAFIVVYIVHRSVQNEG